MCRNFDFKNSTSKPTGCWDFHFLPAKLGFSIKPLKVFGEQSWIWGGCGVGRGWVRGGLGWAGWYHCWSSSWIFSPSFHLPGFHLGYLFLTHGHFGGAALGSRPKASTPPATAQPGRQLGAARGAWAPRRKETTRLGLSEPVRNQAHDQPGLKRYIWVWLKVKQEGVRRSWSMFPLTRFPFWFPFWYRFF